MQIFFLNEYYTLYEVTYAGYLIGESYQFFSKRNLFFFRLKTYLKALYLKPSAVFILSGVKVCRKIENSTDKIA